MKTHSAPRSIRHTIISLAAVSVVALPLLASASISKNTDGTVGIVFSKADLVSTSPHEELYARLQRASRRICGPVNIQATGSLRRSVGNAQCYEGTLTAAVARLDNPEVTALHKK